MVVVAAIATATAAVTTATTGMQRRGGNATETVMDGNGQCDNNATATMAMEGTMATQWQWNVKCDDDNDGRRNGDRDSITNPSKDGTKQNCLCVYIVKVLCSHFFIFKLLKCCVTFVFTPSH